MKNYFETVFAAPYTAKELIGSTIGNLIGCGLFLLITSMSFTLVQISMLIFIGIFSFVWFERAEKIFPDHTWKDAALRGLHMLPLIAGITFVKGEGLIDLGLTYFVFLVISYLLYPLCKKNVNELD